MPKQKSDNVSFKEAAALIKFTATTAVDQALVRCAQMCMGAADAMESGRIQMADGPTALRAMAMTLEQEVAGREPTK